MEKEDLGKAKQWILGSITVIGAVLGILTLTGTHESLRKFLAGLMIILTALFGGANVADSNLSSDVVSESDKSESENEMVTVERVIDGDTIVIDGDIHVRLLGINAPEAGECFYEESKNTLAGLIDGEEVRLEKDVSDKDDFGRLLRYVFLENDLFVNEYLLAEGCADVMPFSQDRLYRRLLTSSRDQAVTERKGMWVACENQEEKAETVFPLEKNNSPENPECLIKGNISEHGYGRTYFLPEDPTYDRTKISFDKGEQYFCTEEEAEAAGYKRAASSY